MTRERNELSQQEKFWQMADLVDSRLVELNSHLNTLSQSQADQFQELATALRVLSEQIEVLQATVEERRITLAHSALTDKPASGTQEVSATPGEPPSSHVRAEFRTRAAKAPQGRLF